MESGYRGLSFEVYLVYTRSCGGSERCIITCGASSPTKALRGCHIGFQVALGLGATTKERDSLVPLLYHRPELSFYLQLWTQSFPVIYLKCSYGLEYLSCSCSGYIVYFFGRTTDKLVFTEYYVLGRF